MVTQELKATIDEALREWEKNLNGGNMAGLAALYTEDGTLMPPDSNPVHGRKGIAEFWQAARDGGVQQILLHIGDVEDHGDMCVEVSRATLTMKGADGATTDVPLKYVVVWKRVNGTWQLHVDIWNTAKPA